RRRARAIGSSRLPGARLSNLRETSSKNARPPFGAAFSMAPLPGYVSNYVPCPGTWVRRILEDVRELLRRWTRSGWAGLAFLRERARPHQRYLPAQEIRANVERDLTPLSSRPALRAPL